MPSGKGGVNAKKQAGRERKDAQKAAKLAEEERKQKQLEDLEWQKGANQRGAARAEEAAAKADEAARKRREKEALLAAEEEILGGGGGGSTKKAEATGGRGGGGAAAKKSKSKKKNELSLLEESLVSNADKQAKAKKKAEREKKEREQRLQMEREYNAAQEAKKKDPLLANTEAMIGAIPDDDDITDPTRSPRLVGRSANVATAQEVGGSGLDSALAALSVSGVGGRATSGEEDMHPEKRMKALHRAFEERMMPIVKEEYPGLRMSQYKEKIFSMWKKSPENPMNQGIPSKPGGGSG